MVDLPYQRERLAERRALYEECDPNGNGFLSVAEIDAVFRRKFGLGGKQKMALIHAFQEAMDFGGRGGGGVDAGYIEHGEFRIFLEILLQKLGEKVVPQPKVKEDLMITHRKVQQEAKAETFKADLPYQRDRLPERKKLYVEIDHNGNGFCSLAEIDAVLRRKYKFGERQRSLLLHAFDETKNFGGNSSGVNADYIEHGEFRAFLEVLMKKLGMKVVPQSPAKENLMINHPKLKAKGSSQSQPFKADLPFQPDRQAERNKLFSECDPNGNGYCSVAEIDAVFRRKYGFGEAQKMHMIHAFNATKNYGGKERGAAAEYIEHSEFRVFMENLAKQLGMTAENAKASPKGGHPAMGSVGSVRGLITVGGTLMAIPHAKPGRSRSVPNMKPLFVETSEAQHHFIERGHMYASMDRKPLVPYNPNSHRSRLAVEDAPVPLKNASAIQFGGGIHVVHKNRFKTMNQSQHTGELVNLCSHGGIIAEHSRYTRMLRDR